MIKIQKHEQLQSIVPDLKIIETKEMPLGISGLYLGKQKVILVKKPLHYKKYNEVLTEEIGHHFTSTGDITNYNDIAAAKQEVKARRFGYELLINNDSLINAWKEGIHNLYEMSEFFGVSQEFIIKGLNHLKQKYGIVVMHNNYRIVYDPLHISKYFEV